MAVKESPRQLIGAFLQEFAGTIFLLFCIFPFPAFFGDSWAGWLVHFFMVIISDTISCGSQVNPSVSVSMFVYGNISFAGMIVRIIAQTAGGYLAFPAMMALTPKHVELGGPTLTTNYIEGAVAEAVMTFLLLILVYFCITYIGDPVKRPVIAIGIRGLIYHGGSRTGPAMNPMIAFGWAALNGKHMEWEHVLVYWIASMFGGAVAALVWGFFHKKKGSEKSD